MAKAKLNPDIIYRKIGSQCILVPVGEQINDVRSIYTLNDSAAFILDLVQENLSEEEIIARLEDEYDCPSHAETSEAVHALIADLKQNQILL